ncbi:MAG: cobalamin-dependent protein [Bacillota bacterium]
MNIDYSKYITELQGALLNTDRLAVEEIIADALGELSKLDLLEKVVTTALAAIGDAWQKGDVALSQVYMSGVICEEIISKIMRAKAVMQTTQPKIAIAVLEDQHQLGKRMVSSVVRAAGYALIDYGAGIGAEQLIEKVLKDKIDILLLSALMLPSALKAGYVCEKLRELGAATKVVVGGAPFRLDPRLVEEVSAYAFGYNASDVIGIIEQAVSADAK